MAGAKPGDDVILTKGPAIETAGILAVQYERLLKERYPTALVERAKGLCTQLTVVLDALTAMEAGGVTAMHNSTEGGVLGGLFEIAGASGVGMEVEEARIIYPDEVRIVCEALGIDPLMAIAEGSLLITADPAFSGRIIEALGAKGIAASIIGKTTAEPDRRYVRRVDGSVLPLRIPQQDPFWPAFFRGLQAG